MGRSERPLGSGTTPAEVFAAELRLLREQAGNPTYLKMHRASGKVRSKTALSEAAGGDHLPTWETVEAYVSALGGDPASWRRRWEDAQEQERRRREGTVRSATTEQARAVDHGGGPLRQQRPVRHLRRAVVLALTVVVTTVIVATVTIASMAGRRVAQGAATTRSRLAGPVAVVVQNKVAIGATSLVEDSSPAYLSSRAVPFCAERGCKIPGTDMWSGAIIPVVCQITGAWMTNADLASKGIAENPGRASSREWYRAVLVDGKTGYISAVYLQARYRTGLQLPRCR
jgi:hypothetical protein